MLLILDVFIECGNRLDIIFICKAKEMTIKGI
jgi:hypothetical protein